MTQRHKVAKVFNAQRRGRATAGGRPVAQLRSGREAIVVGRSNAESRAKGGAECRRSQRWACFAASEFEQEGLAGVKEEGRAVQGHAGPWCFGLAVSALKEQHPLRHACFKGYRQVPFACADARESAGVVGSMPTAAAAWAIESDVSCSEHGFFRMQWCGPPERDLRLEEELNGTFVSRRSLRCCLTRKRRWGRALLTT